MPPRRAPVVLLRARAPKPPPGVPREYRVAEGFGFGYGGRGPSCPHAGRRCINGRCRTLRTLHIYGRKTLPLLANLMFCVAGLQWGGTVTIEIRAPDGGLRRIQKTPLVRNMLRVNTLLPAGPPGRYRITVTTPENKYERWRKVIAAKRRTIRFAPYTPRVGETMLMGLVGFGAHRTVTLHLYRLFKDISGVKDKPGSQEYRYRGTIRFRTDKHGLADARLRIARGVPTGHYYLGTRPGHWQGGFTIDPASKNPR